MNELLPNSIADARFKLLDRVAAARFSGIDLSRVLVNLVDHVEASALPALGWAFGAFGEDWNAATTDERRALIRRVIARRRKRGTPWAIRDALQALGHEVVIRENVRVRHDGTVRRDRTFEYGPHNTFWFWVIVTGARSREAVESVVEAWKRKSTRFAVYFVPDIADALNTLKYSTGDNGVFDFTFDGTFG